MTRSEQVSLKMFEDALLGSDLQHRYMISEYFYEMELGEMSEADLASVQAMNADKTRFLLRYLREFWGTSDAA